MVFRKITIIKATAIKKADLNEQLQYLGGSLGLFSLRDKDKSCFRIFITLVRDLQHKQGLTSDELALQTRLTRGTVVHHLNKLLEAGIVELHRGQYFLAVENLHTLVDKVEHDILHTLKQLRLTAQELDDALGLQRKTTEKQEYKGVE